MIQVHVFFSGTVQGVGFRYTVRRLAHDLGLNGWVRNLADGRVEMLAQGSKDRLEVLLNEVEDHFKGYIRDRKIEYGQAEGNLDSFRIAI